MNKFGCTSPFIPLAFRYGAEICTNSTRGRQVHKHMMTETGRFSTIMWMKDYYFMPPCSYNTFAFTKTDFGTGKERTIFVGSTLKMQSTKTDFMQLYFVSKMFVTEQFWAYTFLAYIAECGGFVGLFLGYSVLQIGDFFKMFDTIKLK